MGVPFPSQHFLYFSPLPQGHRSFRPTLIIIFFIRFRWPPFYLFHPVQEPSAEGQLTECLIYRLEESCNSGYHFSIIILRDYNSSFLEIKQLSGEIMKRTPIVGVMGGGNADFETIKAAETLGGMIAEKGWILLNGGRCTGVMEATSKGAYEKGGVTVGVLPDSNTDGMSQYIRIPIVTGMGNARNTINILSSDVVVACPGGAGTLSEMALSIKCNKPLILFGFNPESDLTILMRNQGIYLAQKPEDVIRKIEELIQASMG
jgi:uncharacterized protein (TIGR00725 family)